jgi:mannose-6-phosphate isomerase-like protein (cupin superfamily)
MAFSRLYHVAAGLVLLIIIGGASAALHAFEGNATDTQPLAFGPDQRIIGLGQVHWTPLQAPGVKPGTDIAVLRGTLKSGPVDLLIRLPANYTFPVHSHSSDETYVWISGNFTYIAEDGTAVKLPGQTFISLPSNTPHALACGGEPCIFYVHYSQTFDMKTFPMPKLKPASTKSG